MKLSSFIMQLLRSDYLHSLNFGEVLITKGYQEYKKLSVVSGGDSKTEEFMAQLRDSAFGHSYWHAQFRGGLEEYLIPMTALESDPENQWGALINPVLNPLPMFHLLPGHELQVVSEPTLRYINPNDPAQALINDFNAQLRHLSLKYGEDILKEFKISETFSQKLGDGWVRAELKYEDSSDHNPNRLGPKELLSELFPDN